jgi:hypothetical protein
MDPRDTPHGLGKALEGRPVKRIVLTEDSAELVAKLVTEQPGPTAAMLDFFAEEPDLVWTIEVAPPCEGSRGASPQPSRT